MTLHVLSLATLFPDAARPNFGLFVERSLRALAAQPDVAVTVVAPVGIPPWPLSLHPHYRPLRSLPRVEQWNGLTVQRPRFPLIPRYGARWNPALVARAAEPIAHQLHAERKLDVIDAQFFYPDGPAGMRLAAQFDVPYSVKARGADISHWGHAPESADAVRRAGQGAAGLLAVSAALRDDMVALGMDASSIRVHYTGIDTGRFHPIDDGPAAALRQSISGGAPLIATVGALIPRKGQELVIRALPALTGVHYALAGAGEAAADYRVLAASLGVADRVHLLGPVANAQLPTLYRAADVVVMPSVSEGLANAWVEALACGTPIVISEAGGARELVTSAVSGRIVARDPAAIAAAVQALLANPPDRAAVAASLDGRFDWDRNGRELAAHLRACAAR